MAGNEGLNFSFSCSPPVLLSSSERELCYACTTAVMLRFLNESSLNTEIESGGSAFREV